MPAARRPRRAPGWVRAPLLLTHKLATIGAMSCNPAIGGLGRGHLVREIDALDGVMARAIDAGGIQFRVLNRSKGPAVQGPRAQADRKLYARAVRALLDAQPGLDLREAEVEDLIVEAGRIAGVVDRNGTELRAGAVILTTGTFLRGEIHLGDGALAGRPSWRPPGHSPGREPAAPWSAPGPAQDRHAAAAGRADHRPCGARRSSPGDDPPVPFSFLTERLPNPQIACWITHTNAAHVTR